MPVRTVAGEISKIVVPHPIKAKAVCAVPDNYAAALPPGFLRESEAMELVKARKCDVVAVFATVEQVWDSQELVFDERNNHDRR